MAGWRLRPLLGRFLMRRILVTWQLGRLLFGTEILALGHIVVVVAAVAVRGCRGGSDVVDAVGRPFW